MKLSFLCLLFLLEVSGQQFKPGCTRPTLVNGRIKIRARGKMIHFRCRKRYTRYGAKYAFCMQGTTWSHPPPLCIARGCPPITNLPNTQIIESFSGALYKFQCAVGLKRSGPEVITCDGKRWSDDPPTCSASLSFKCDFEDSNLCGWSQGSKDDFDWIRTSGVTPTMNTGPQFDHTFMNASLGHYMFIESSSPRNSGDKAKLISPAYPAKLSEMCVEIWYHMLGPDGEDAVGSLEVYVKPVSMDTLDDISPDFYVAGNQGNQWHRGVFKIESQNEDFQLVVVGTRKDAFVSDIAIDDIRLYNCSEDTTTTAATTYTTATTHMPSTSEITKSLVTTNTSLGSTSSQTSTPTKRSTTTTSFSNIKTTVVSTVPSTPTTSKSTTLKTTSTTTSATSKTTPLTTVITSTTATTKKRSATGSATSTTYSLSGKTKTTTVTILNKSTLYTTTNHVTTKTTDTANVTTMLSVSTSEPTEQFQDSTPDANTTRAISTTAPTSTSTSPKSSIINNTMTTSFNTNTTASYSTAKRPTAKTTSGSNALPSKEPKQETNTTTFRNDIVPTVLSSVGKPKNLIHRFIPLIIGISCGIAVGMVVIGILAYLWTRHQRRKKTKELEDELMIITTADGGYYNQS